MIIAQRTQLLQTLGSIAASAANSAAEGIAEAAKTDSKTVDTALNLFGGFDRSEFENINTQSPNLLVPAVRPPASYEGPSEYFKPLSNTVEGQSLLVPAKDLLQQLEDPRFRITDGLSNFSDHRITQTLVKEQMILNNKSGGDMSLGGVNENGIIIVGGKPADPADMAASLDSFGKLYRMENTVEKQLQLHEQLDLGALGRVSAARQTMLPTTDSPKLNQELKGIPDVRAAAPQSKEMLDLPLNHALNGRPQNVGDIVQMLDVLIAEGRERFKEIDHPGYQEYAGWFLHRLSEFKSECQNLPANSLPTDELFEKFEDSRQGWEFWF
jgi:hypothetical protein